MPRLELVNISKRIGDSDILKDTNLEVSDKESLAITGPPGSGKTTLLKIIAGLIEPDTGDIIMDGEKITDVPPGKRDIGMMFEVPPVYPDRKGYDNIALPLKLQGFSEDLIRDKVNKTAEFLQIKHVLNRKPDTFSGGEYQRVALARTLVREPKILLLDEPLRNLDAKIRERMRVWFKRLQRRLKITMIYAAFDPVEAMSVGDQVAVMLEGEIKQMGKPLEVYEEPNDTSVAKFVIPSLNLLEGDLITEKDKSLLRFNNLELELPTHLKKFKAPPHHKEKVTIGIRPEDMNLLYKKDPKFLECIVTFIQNVGDEKLVTVGAKDVQLRVIAPKGFQVKLKDNLFLKIREEKVLLFDKKTQKLILSTT